MVSLTIRVWGDSDVSRPHKVIFSPSTQDFTIMESSSERRVIFVESHHRKKGVDKKLPQANKRIVGTTTIEEIEKGEDKHMNALFDVANKVVEVEMVDEKRKEFNNHEDDIMGRTSSVLRHKSLLDLGREKKKGKKP